MPFWKSESEEERSRRERQEQSLRDIEQGGLPLIAKERIQRQQAIGKNFFSTDLTAREFMLCRHGEFQTLSQVMGSCFYSINNYGRNRNIWWNSTGVMHDYMLALTAARRRAIQRMEQEAALMNASGVIGVRVNETRPKWETNVCEYTAVGTAIRLPDAKATDQPFTSILNGQEFWQLYHAGYTPKGIAIGIGAYYVQSSRRNRQQTGRGFWGNMVGNIEVQDHTDALREAQFYAQTSFYADIAKQNGDGAVGVDAQHELIDVEYESNDVTYHDLMVTFTLIGTIVTNTHAPIEKHSGLIYYDLNSPSRAAKAAKKTGTNYDTGYGEESFT